MYIQNLFKDAAAMGKPLVLEEFGLARDWEPVHDIYDADSQTTYHDFFTLPCTSKFSIQYPPAAQLEAIISGLGQEYPAPEIHGLAILHRNPRLVFGLRH